MAVPASAMPNMPHLFGEREVARCGGDVAHVRHPYRTNRYKPGENPLFTDFTASNIGTPANPRLPYYAEDRADARAMGLQVQVLNASTSREINAAFASFVRERPDAPVG